MGLIAHYPLFENAKDFSMYKNHGKSSGIVYAQDSTSLLGGSAYFNLDTNKITIPHSEMLADSVFGVSNFLSISIWAYPISWIDYGVLINKAFNTSLSNISVGIWQTLSGFSFTVGSNIDNNPAGSYVTVTSKPTLNAWHHLVGIIDGVQLKFYIDGVIVGTANLSSIVTSRSKNIDDLSIGPRISTGTDSKLRGRYADLRIYDHALSAKEIKNLGKVKILQYDELLSDRTVKDISGYARDTEVISDTIGISMVDDGIITDRCLNFNSGSYITLPGNYNFLQKFTLSIWINMTDFEIILTLPAIIYNYSISRLKNIVKSSNGNVIDIELDGGISFKIPGVNSTALSTTGIFNSEVDKWINVVCTYDQSIRKIYVNGELKKSETIGAGTVTLGTLYINDNTGTANSLKGKVHDIRMYGTALSDSDVKEIYNLLSSVDEDGNLYIKTFKTFVGFYHKFYDMPFPLDNRTPGASITGDFDILSVRNGIMRLESTSINPMMVLGNIMNGLTPSKYRYFQCKYKVISGTPVADSMQIYFANGRSHFAEDQSIKSTEFISDGQWHVTTIDMGLNQYWTNSDITNIRFDFVSDINIIIEIEYIQIISDLTQSFSLSEKGYIEAKSLSNTIVEDGLIHWWVLNNTKTNLVNPNIPIEIFNSPKAVSGLGLMCYETNGTSQYMRIPFSNTNIDHFSLSFWVFLDPSIEWTSQFNILSGSITTGNGRIVLYNKSSTVLSLYMYINNKEFSIDIPNAFTIFSNKWSNVVIGFSNMDNDAIMSLYVNGILIGSIIIDETFNYIDQTYMYFMSDRGIQYYTKGKLSNIRIYKRILQLADVKSLYQFTGGDLKSLMKISEDGNMYIKGSVRGVLG